jgi:hypothetical protein
MPARIAAMVAAGLAGLLALGLIAAGGLLLWGDSRKDDQGYLSTRTERFATNTYALTTDNVDVDVDGAGWIVNRDRFGRIRLTVESNDSQPVFVGIARTTDAERYLAGSGHDLVTDIEYTPFSADYRRLDGDRKPAAPAAQKFWEASVHGSGRQTLTWDVDDGDRSIVVMNEDASRQVDVGVKAGAEVDFLSEAGWGSLIAGLIVLSLAALLAVLGIRQPARKAIAA